MPIEAPYSKVEKEKKDDDEKSLVEHLVNLRLIVGRMLSGDIETASGASSTVGSRRFDPQNQTARSTVVSDDSGASDNSGVSSTTSDDD